MKTLLLLCLPLACLALTLSSANGQSLVEIPAGATNSTTASTAPAAPEGILILRAVAGYDAAGIAFTSIQWSSTDGGSVTDASGNKTAFVNEAIGKIIYFDETYYAEIDHNPYWVDWRAGLQSREVVVPPIETIRLVPNDAPRLQSEQTLLQDIVAHFSAGQPLVQPMIDTLKDQCAKLASGQMLSNGKWISASQSQVYESSSSVPSVGENSSALTFTTKSGRKFVNARVSLNDTGVSVITDDGGGSLTFADLPDDLTGFPDVVRKRVTEWRENGGAAQSSAAVAPATPSTAAATPAPGFWASAGAWLSSAWSTVCGWFASGSPAPAPAAPASTNSGAGSH